MKKIRIPEIFILILTIVLIVMSEYYYVVENNPDKAMFIGLWPPTMLGLLIYINQKTSE